MQTQARTRHTIQAVTDAETVARLKAAATAKGLSPSNLANQYITKGLEAEQPLLGSIDEFERYIVNELMVDSPAKARQVTSLVQRLMNTGASA